MDKKKEILQKSPAKAGAARKGLRRALRFAAYGALSLFALSVIQVAYVRFVDPPGTVPMMVRWMENKISRKPSTPSQYHWIPKEKVPVDFLACVYVTEDEKFFTHHGFDWAQIRKARMTAVATGKPARGASTITQQCARSLFLWQNRSWIRKGLEAYYTVLMEVMLPKARILELYANVIEFGDGIYGIEAAAQHYYHVPASQLTRQQAAMLIAIMPNPRLYDPLKPSERVLKRQEMILEKGEFAGWPTEIVHITMPAPNR